MAKEFVLFSDNHVLQFIMQQLKLNHKHAKWVEFPHGFTFVFKHISGQANKVVDALRKRSLIMKENQVQVLCLDYLKDLYELDAYFQESFEACKNHIKRDRSQWGEYMLHDGLLFKNS